MVFQGVDDLAVLNAYYFADRFGWPPDVVERQDEAMMTALSRFDRQVNYTKWVHAHGGEDDFDNDEDGVVHTAFSDVPSYRELFGRN